MTKYLHSFEEKCMQGKYLKVKKKKLHLTATESPLLSAVVSTHDMSNKPNCHI